MQLRAEIRKGFGVDILPWRSCSSPARPRSSPLDSPGLPMSRKISTGRTRPVQTRTCWLAHGRGTNDNHQPLHPRSTHHAPKGSRPHRPSGITSPDESAVPGSDITHNTLRYSRLLRAVPDLEQSRGAFDFINVETISRQVVEEVARSALAGGQVGGWPWMRGWTKLLGSFLSATRGEIYMPLLE